MKRVCVLAVLAMGVAMSASADATSVRITFQDGVSPTPDYAGTADAHIISWDGSQNQTGRLADGKSDPGTAGGGDPQNAGAHCYIEEGDYNENGGNLDSKVILIKFDVSSISPASKVGSAKVGLYYRYERATAGGDACGGSNSGPGSDSAVASGRSNAHFVYAAKVLKPWIEGTGGGYSAGGVDGADTADGVAVTWNHSGVELWEAIGAEGPSDTEMPESATWFKPVPHTWLWLDVTQMCRDWVANPETNYGVKISQEPNNIAGDGDGGNGAQYVGGAYDFVASENDIDPITARPKLVVDVLASSSAGPDWSLYR